MSGHELELVQDAFASSWIAPLGPHVDALERELVNDAFASNWIAPLGPHVDAFEREFAAAVGVWWSGGEWGRLLRRPGCAGTPRSDRCGRRAARGGAVVGDGTDRC